MTPLDFYREQCAKDLLSEDAQQLHALTHLQRVYYDLLKEYKKRNPIWAFWRSPRLVTGVYLCGGVGIGKTFLLDCFYNALPFPQKMRMHFHQFMQLIHQLLKNQAGKKNPLDKIADILAKKNLVICFDELFVSDITDAMLLGKLFKALFARKVCLVATSNSLPDDLYKNGLQREQFLPAIAALKNYLEIVFLNTTIDYRLRHLKEAGIFYTPLGALAEANMEKSFALLAQNAPVDSYPVSVYGRRIGVKKKTADMVWFEFVEICTIPRSQADYLALAQQYRTIFISNIPVIPAHANDTICLFIALVDIFYDAKVRLVISAAEPIAALYSRGYKILEYARTHSRLLEMQSLDYFLT